MHSCTCGALIPVGVFCCYDCIYAAREAAEKQRTEEAMRARAATMKAKQVRLCKTDISQSKTDISQSKNEGDAGGRPAGHAAAGERA